MRVKDIGTLEDLSTLETLYRLKRDGLIQTELDLPNLIVKKWYENTCDVNNSQRKELCDKIRDYTKYLENWKKELGQLDKEIKRKEIEFKTGIWMERGLIELKKKMGVTRHSSHD